MKIMIEQFIVCPLGVFSEMWQYHEPSITKTIIFTAIESPRTVQFSLQITISSYK